MSFQYLSYLWYVIVEVAGTKDDEDIEIAAANQVEDFVFLYHALLHIRSEVVVDQL